MQRKYYWGTAVKFCIRHQMEINPPRQYNSLLDCTYIEDAKCQYKNLQLQEIHISPEIKKTNISQIFFKKKALLRPNINRIWQEAGYLSSFLPPLNKSIYLHLLNNPVHLCMWYIVQNSIWAGSFITFCNAARYEKAADAGWCFNWVGLKLQIPKLPTINQQLCCSFGSLLPLCYLMSIFGVVHRSSPALVTVSPALEISVGKP